MPITLKIHPSGKTTISTPPPRIAGEKEAKRERKETLHTLLNPVPEVKPERKHYPGLSSKSKNKIYNSIALLLKRTPRNKGYHLFTVTLPVKQKDNYTDSEISRMFIKFLNNLRTNYNLKFYIWVAERQKNGNLHYHFITNIYINPLQLSVYWERFFQHGHRNSVDRITVYRWNDLKKYLVKYISKDKHNIIYSRKIGRTENLSDKAVYADPDDVSDMHLVKEIKFEKEGFEYTCYLFDPFQIIDRFFNST